MRVSAFTPEFQWLYSVSHWATDLRPSKTLNTLQDSVRLCQANPDMDWNRIRDWAMGSKATAKYAALFGELLDRFELWPAERPLPADWPVAKKLIGRRNSERLISIIEAMGIDGQSKWRGLGYKNVLSVWDTLLSERGPMRAALSVPWQILFPSSDPDRYRLTTLRRRLRSLFFPPHYPGAD